jgi:hypothetical protein
MIVRTPSLSILAWVTSALLATSIGTPACKKSEEHGEPTSGRALESLPYFAATPIQPGEECKVGVVQHAPDQARPG